MLSENVFGNNTSASSKYPWFNYLIFFFCLHKLKLGQKISERVVASTFIFTSVADMISLKKMLFNSVAVNCDTLKEFDLTFCFLKRLNFKSFCIPCQVLGWVFACGLVCVCLFVLNLQTILFSCESLIEAWFMC